SGNPSNKDDSRKLGPSYISGTTAGSFSSIGGTAILNIFRYLSFAERLAQVGEEIQHVENNLRECRRLLTAFWRHLRPANPTGEGSKSAKRGKCAKAVS
ncbi:hypothetical protein TIFTF001_050389, partial [Ficus carica]